VTKTGKDGSVLDALSYLPVLAAQGASGDDPSFPWGVVIIVAIVLAVLAAGLLLARKAFTRGTMPAKPSQDRPDTASVGAGDQPGVTADPRAMGRPSDRGYEQNPSPRD